jgi:hypothetical protein
MRLTGVLVIVALFLFACKKQRSVVEQTPVPSVNADTTVAIVEPDTVIYYERTACFGMCPIFTYLVLSNGDAFYEGRNFVDRIGRFRSNMDQTALQSIQKLSAEINYFSLNPSYDNPHVSDVPSVITRLRFGEQDLKVVNRFKGPKSLLRLYESLDQIIADTKWETISEEEKK